MTMQMRAVRNKYTKEWNNESLVEHNLTHYSTNAQRRCVGKVDFRSPSRTMIEKESMSQNDAIAIWEDAEDCANKFNFLLLAQTASEAAGIHRANSNAGLKVFCAIQYYCEGKSQRTIGNMIDKRHAVVDRYIDRFTEWSASNCPSLAGKVQAEHIIKLCKKHMESTSSLAEALDELRCELTDLFHDLLKAARNPENPSSEVYLDIQRFQQAHSTFDIPKLLTTI